MSETKSQSFGGQVLALGLVQVVLKLRLLILLPVFTRLLTPGDLGIYSILTAFAALVQMVCVMGTNTSLQVFLPGEKSAAARNREFWSLAQVMALEALIVIAALAALRGPVLGLYGGAGIRPLHYVLALAVIPFQALNALFLSQALNNRQARDYARITTLASAVELGIMIGAAYRFGLPGVLGALIFKQALLLALMGRAVLRVNPFTALSAAVLPGIRKYYSYGLIMFLAGFAALIVEHSDKFILGKLLDMDRLGMYSVSYGVCLFTAELALPIFSILLPFVTGAVAEGQHDRARYYLEQSFRALMLIYTPAVLFFSMQARELLGVFTVKAYFGGAVIFPWVTAGIALYQIMGIHTYTLHAHKKGWVMLVSLAASATVNVGLNLWLIPRYGIVAAAWSTFAAYVVHFAIVRQAAMRCIRVRYGAGFLARLAVCGAGAWGGMYAARYVPGGPAARLFAALALGGAAYALLLIATNCMPADERRRLLALAGQAIRPGAGQD